jgi:hypothetical protein
MKVIVMKHLFNEILKPVWLKLEKIKEIKQKFVVLQFFFNQKFTKVNEL